MLVPRFIKKNYKLKMFKLNASGDNLTSTDNQQATWVKEITAMQFSLSVSTTGKVWAKEVKNSLA